MILVPAGWLETITRKKNKFSIKWSKKPIIIGSPWNIAMHVIHLVPSFFISMSMIIILFVIRKDVPLYFHFTSIKTEQQYRTPLLQLLPSGEYFTKKKILQGIHLQHTYWVTEFSFTSGKLLQIGNRSIN